MAAGLYNYYLFTKAFGPISFTFVKTSSLQNPEFHALGQSLLSLWEQSAKAYASYMDGGKKFRYAEILKLHNTAAKNLLVTNITLIPGPLRSDAAAIIEHYSIWSAKWDALKSRLNPAPDDEFVFENNHRFPKAAAQNIEAALHNLP